MKPILKDNNASAIPIILFLITIFGCGALYTLLFIEIGYPIFQPMIPASDSKVFIMMCMYAIPLFLLLIGVISLINAGLKRTGVYQ